MINCLSRSPASNPGWLETMWSTALYFQMVSSQCGQWIGTFVQGEAVVDFLAEPYLKEQRKWQFDSICCLLPWVTRRVEHPLAPQKPQGLSPICQTSEQAPCMWRFNNTYLLQEIIFHPSGVEQDVLPNMMLKSPQLCFIATERAFLYSGWILRIGWCKHSVVNSKVVISWITPHASVVKVKPWSSCSPDESLYGNSAKSQTWGNAATFLNISFGCTPDMNVEQRRVYSIYYYGTLTLPYKRRGERAVGAVAVRVDSGGEQETLLFYTRYRLLYILSYKRDGRSCIAWLDPLRVT